MDRSFSFVDFILCTLVLAALYAIDFAGGASHLLSLAPAAVGRAFGGGRPGLGDPFHRGRP